MSATQRVLITGGGGYVGAVLAPKLLDAGYRVRIIDLFIYGEDVLDAVRDDPGMEIVKGDIRDAACMESAIAGCDAVIHLACISNDPSFELNPALGKSINLDAFAPMTAFAKKHGVRRFIYASSSSVYGIKEDENVTEDLPLLPLTDYSKFKAQCEEILNAERAPGFETVIIRPATVCGYSPRLRLDLTVNILTNHAVNRGKITVFGGSQKRPNIHIDDITDLYVDLLARPAEEVDGKTWNAGYENHTVRDIAEMVRRGVGREGIEIATEPTDDLRSYHISSKKIETDLGFVPKHTIEDAVRDLTAAFDAGKIPNPMDDVRYYNVKMMQKIEMR